MEQQHLELRANWTAMTPTICAQVRSTWALAQVVHCL
jgi:hypothetical protein